MSTIGIDKYKEEIIRKVKEQFKNKVGTGTDAKQLQYEDFAVDLCYNPINLTEILHDKIIDISIGESDSNPKDTNCNCMVINIEKDVIRYQSIVSELKKIGMTGFVHLKATYWKEKKSLN